VTATRAITATALALVVVGSLLLRAASSDDTLSPVVSAANGAPHGILALARLLAHEERDVTMRLRHDEAMPLFDTLFVPPPEAAAWTKAEARALVERVQAGAHVVICCDDDEARNARMRALTDETGVRCVEGDEITDARLRLALAENGAPVAELAHRASGSIALDEGALAITLARDDTDAVVAASVGIGRGTVTTTLAALVANDTLHESDNAAFALWMARGPNVVIDEAHHVPRRQEVLRAAFGKPGPIAGALALLLLMPLALLSLAPRAGDAPRADANGHAMTAEEAARALANLYRRSGVSDARTDVPSEVK
jgi:hypothetical protein